MPLSRFALPSRSGGRTRFELLVRVLVVGILAAILLERMLYYQEQAERTVMETTIIHIRSGMRLHIADLMTQQRTNEIAAMLDENPVRWLDHPPGGYLGALDAVPDDGIPGGSWYFDSAQGELVYVPKWARFFTGMQGKREARFKVKARVVSRALVSGQALMTEGIDIVPSQAYKWF
ncbi:general secretion pathway protein G [Paucimonas lemoignei]|uniref:General secretion pathway protein G n=1 Tax=Paucimonas lemoignei TaxID=29443 RepID=A0A4R3I0L8_PAULE|nr:hypothetical protein [Paucimonas lemoignei]TCS39072.1 general secretion pathway protein G [Paucimonas lemoignei]